MWKIRKNIRLKGYDYSQSGYYFVTICTENRECLFGDIVGARRDTPTYMELNPMGKIIENIWESLPKHHPVELDIFQIMPNHVHFILRIISDTSQTGRSCPLITGASRRAPTLGWIIGMFKTECTKQINMVNKTPGCQIFQRNYYERIIRDEEEYIKIKTYIKQNPMMWGRDRNNPMNILL